MWLPDIHSFPPCTISPNKAGQMAINHHHRSSAMKRSLTLRALAVLVLLILAEIVNGTLRALAITPWVGDFTARQISTLTGCALIFGVTWTLSPWLNAATPRQQWAVGALWLVLMMVFELAFGRLVAGVPWDSLAADYNLARGGLLGLGMAWLLCAPRLTGLLRKKCRQRNEYGRKQLLNK